MTYAFLSRGSFDDFVRLELARLVQRPFMVAAENTVAKGEVDLFAGLDPA
jgi:hypothetical protein